MSSKDKYAALCDRDESIPVFSRPWWLDATAGPAMWDVALAERGGIVTAAMPFCMRRRAWLTALKMPPLTQVLGPHIVNRSYASENERLSAEKSQFQALLNALPVADYVQFYMHNRYTNWLPFYWAGYRQTTLYSYEIPNIEDSDKVFANFERSKQKDVRKASKLVGVAFDLDAEQFYKNHELVLRKQGRTISYSYDLFRRIHDAAYRHASGRTIYAVDVRGNLHAALFVVWAREGAYDLISTIDPDFRQSGAASLVVNEAIKLVAPYSHRFDFEGSMDERVEASFRHFGAIQRPYMALKKVTSLLLRAREALYVARR